jgi:hypothetical protein
VKENYLSLFLLSLMFQFLLLSLSLQQGHEVCLYVLLAFSICSFSWLLLYRPYQSTFSNICILLNAFLIFSYQGYIVFRNSGLIPISNEYDLFTCLVFACLLVACELCACVRVIRVILNKIRLSSLPQKVTSSLQANNQTSSDKTEQILDREKPEPH